MDGDKVGVLLGNVEGGMLGVMVGMLELGDKVGSMDGNDREGLNDGQTVGLQGVGRSVG